MSNTMLKIKTLLSKVLTWIKNPRTLSGNGYQWDDYGNLKHLRSSTSDTLNVKKGDGTVVARIYYESGTVELLTGNMRILSTNHGVWGTDSTGFVYPFAFDNGSNLWMGSTMTATQHHKGETFISTGYNGSGGNETIKVCVPNASNTGGTSYKVLHDGLAPTRATVTLTDAVAYDSGRTPYVYKYGKVVTLVGAVKPKAQVAAGGTLAIGTIPSGYRPPVFHNVLCQGSGQNVWNLGVNTNGTLVGERYRAGTTNNPMPTTAWLTFSITYIIA